MDLHANHTNSYLRMVPNAEDVLSAAQVAWLRAVGLQKTSLRIEYGAKRVKFYCIVLKAPPWGMGSDVERAKNAEMQHCV